jgi:serine/threonine protein kinase
MDVVDRPLLAHVQSMKSKQIEWLRTALMKLCKLLVLLQKDVSFMHGDMHGENIMVRNNHDIFIIDFGMSSATFSKRRLITSKRYTRVPFHSQLDLLTLMTSLREDFALSKHFTAAAWCGSFVQPFWTIVRDAVVSGKQTNLPFGALKTVRTALNEISTSGEVYYAHHLLYEDIGRVAYSECEPSTMLKRLQTATSVHTEPVQERIFERV